MFHNYFVYFREQSRNLDNFGLYRITNLPGIHCKWIFNLLLDTYSLNQVVQPTPLFKVVTLFYH
uniref:Uncharacterized protein n=1 Tax=Lepeophtheirus salmonis TaxID=72036 RepID=A0A0K2SWL7_LEPSM